jgi:sortase B
MKAEIRNAGKKAQDLILRSIKKYTPVNRAGWIRLAVLTVAVPLFIFSAARLGSRLIAYSQEDAQIKEITDLKPTSTQYLFDTIPTSPSNETPVDLPYEVVYGTDTSLNDAGRLAEYEKLWQRNNDLAGWITMDGFPVKPIDYPILFSGDNVKYLNLNFDKKTNLSGSIFLDETNIPYRENPRKLDYNYVLYGHAMNNGGMFGNITDYFKNETSWKTSTRIFVDFMNTRLEYEVFATFLADPYDNYRQTDFVSDKEYQIYLNGLMAKSTHDFGVKVTSKDRIVTLSTCYKTTMRCAVVGRLVRQIIYLGGTGTPVAQVTPKALPPR